MKRIIGDLNPSVFVSVLDFDTSSVVVYKIRATEDPELFLEKEGHNLANCQFMISEGYPLEVEIKEYEQSKF